MKTSNHLLIFLGFIVFIFNIKAHADGGHYAYRVTSPSKTVIQIARDVYSDERLWKKIAYWNNIQPPHKLSVGQILVLPEKPKNSIPQENLVTGQEVPKPNFSSTRPTVEREISKESDHYIYTVNERAPYLSMVAIENYGDRKMASQIAQWNNLPPNAKLSLQQKLILKFDTPPTIQEATGRLISLWRSMKNEDMVQRLQTTQLQNIQVTETKSEVRNKKVSETQPDKVETEIMKLEANVIAEKNSGMTYTAKPKPITSENITQNTKLSSSQVKAVTQTEALKTDTKIESSSATSSEPQTKSDTEVKNVESTKEETKQSWWQWLFSEREVSTEAETPATSSPEN